VNPGHANDIHIRLKHLAKCNELSGTSTSQFEVEMYKSMMGNSVVLKVVLIQATAERQRPV
jgi:hypothetical protein